MTTPEMTTTEKVAYLKGLCDGHLLSMHVQFALNLRRTNRIARVESENHFLALLVSIIS